MGVHIEHAPDLIKWTALPPPGLLRIRLLGRDRLLNELHRAGPTTFYAHNYRVPKASSPVGQVARLGHFAFRDHKQLAPGFATRDPPINSSGAAPSRHWAPQT